jgi:hypothetical protein
VPVAKPLDPVKRYRSLLTFIFEPLTHRNWRSSTDKAARILYPFERQFFSGDVRTLDDARALQARLRAQHGLLAQRDMSVARRSVARTIEERFRKYAGEVLAIPKRTVRREIVDVFSLDGKEKLLRKGERVMEWSAPSVRKVLVCLRPDCGRPVSLRPDSKRNRVTCDDPKCRNWRDDSRRRPRTVKTQPGP